MKIGTDKWKHFGINYAICALLGNYGVPFALGASLGKEYGDKMSPGNKWDWKDILADLAGIVAGYLTHVCIVWTIMWNFQLYQYDGNDNYSDYYGSLHGWPDLVIYSPIYS